MGSRRPSGRRRRQGWPFGADDTLRCGAGPPAGTVRNPVPVSSVTIHGRKGMDGKTPAPSTAAAVWEREALCFVVRRRVTGATGSAGNRGRGAPGSVSDGASARMPPRIIRKDANPKREDALVKAWVEGTPWMLDVSAVATRSVRDARPEQGLEAEKRRTSVLPDNGEEAGSLVTGHRWNREELRRGKERSGKCRESAIVGPRQETG